ncbi:MAG: type II toxin-antitoxin system PemK/MazF family toxin [Dehalococcoidia bacterium]|nr:type II toxin-antitoxin system PemK/MazF family toxin [Dehalococcoidia bacterium]
MMTPSTTIFSRGDIVLVPFQFTDKPIAKVRPAAVVSSTSYHSARQEVIIAAITSRVRDPLLFGDHLILGWRTAGLPKPSVVTAILRTVKQGMIARRVGRLAEDDLAHVDGHLAVALALTAAAR